MYHQKFKETKCKCCYTMHFFENLTEKIRNKLHDMESTIKRLEFIRKISCHLNIVIFTPYLSTELSLCLTKHNITKTQRPEVQSHTFLTSA